MRILTKISSLLALFAITMVPQQAFAQQAQGSPQSQARPNVVVQFDDQTMRYLLADLNASWTVERGADNLLVYRARTDNNINFVLAPRACDAQPGCVGLMLIALFNDVNASNVTSLDAFIHRFNDAYPTAKVMRDPQGLVALQTYINVAYGVTYRNVQAQILVFGQDISNLSRALVTFENAQR